MKELVCINCPNSCHLLIDENTLQVSGNRCPRGETFAKDELTRPMRTLCSSVKTVFTDVPVIAVKVSGQIPKDKIFEVMKEINKITVKERMPIGSIVIKNVLDLGVNVVISSGRMMETNHEG